MLEERVNLLLSHVKDHYKLLRHGEMWSQVHAQDKQKNKLLDRRLIKGENQLLAWVSQFNGRGDLYIGRNPRMENSKVEKISCISVDIDPVREKDTASTLDQLQEALKAGKHLSSRDKFSRGIVASSGNGCHVYWPLFTPWPVTKENEEKIRQFENEIRKVIEEKFNVKVDAIYDSPRLVKIIGTQATKGQLSQRRMARFLSPINWGKVFNNGISERLQDYSGEKRYQIPTGLPKTDHVDRSKLDYALALRLKRDGASPNDIRSALSTYGYRAKERPDDIERIIVKLFQEQQSGMDRQFMEELQPIELFTPSTHFDEYERRIGEEKERGNAELPTGIPTLDSYTNGLKKKGIWVVGARTGIGKTSFSITVTTHLLKMGKRVLFFSTEMGGFDIFNRFISAGSGVSLFDLERGKLSQSDETKYKEYRDQFKSEDLFICDKAEPRLREVAETVSRIRPDVLVFDHIQRVAHSTDQRYLELATFIKGLNNICRENDCAAIVNSQLNRIAEKEVPTLSHLKECGALEEEAHAVILLSSIAKGDSNSLVIADLAKNRGPKGQVQLKFHKSPCKFEEAG